MLLVMTTLPRHLFGLGLLGLAVVGCRDDSTTDDEIAESTTDSSDTSESGTSESDSTTEATTSSDSSSDSTDSDAGSGSDSTTDSTDSTGGDPSCEDDQYTGVGIADDNWGLGDFCDEIWVCADEAQVASILAVAPDSVCEPSNDCPVSHCTLSFGAVIDAALLTTICDALLVPGIDEALCLVLGP